MISKPPARRFEQFYTARPQHDELRRGLSRDLLKWADGTVDSTLSFPSWSRLKLRIAS